jgi:hypothetical protein
MKNLLSIFIFSFITISYAFCQTSDIIYYNSSQTHGSLILSSTDCTESNWGYLWSISPLISEITPVDIEIFTTYMVWVKIDYFDSSLNDYVTIIDKIGPTYNKLTVMFKPNTVYDIYVEGYSSIPPPTTNVFSLSFNENTQFSQNTGNWTKGDMFIDGKLGIGTMVPKQKLDLNGPIRGGYGTGGALEIKSDYGSMYLGAQNESWGHIYTDRPLIIVNKPFYTFTGEFSSYSSNNLSLLTGGYNRMTILRSNGYVGIGRSDPYYQLDVMGKARVKNEFIADGSGNEGGRISIINSTKTAINQAYNWSIYNMTNFYGNSLQFWAYDTANNLKHNRFTINDDGKIGIGTNLPLAKLHVNSGPNNSYAAILATSNDGNNLVVSSYDTQPANCKVFQISHEYSNSSANRNNGYIAFYRGSDVSGGFLDLGTNGISRLFINSDGNIGIGTSV